jgi:hypothetical protein
MPVQVVPDAGRPSGAGTYTVATIPATRRFGRLSVERNGGGDNKSKIEC